MKLQLLKFALFTLNFLTAIGGIFLIYVGVRNFHCHEHQKLILGLFPLGKGVGSSFVPSLAITAGLIVFIISVLGFYGSITDNTCLIKTYARVLAIAAFGLAFLTFFALQYPKVLSIEATEIYRENFEIYDQNKISKEIVDKVQKGSKCCGTTGPKSWGNYKMKIPSSCCEMQASCTLNNSYQTGCINLIKDLFENFVKIREKTIGLSSFFFAIILFAGVFITCYLADSLENNYYSVFA